ncbi:MAG: RluA family pseudouridine synthase [Vicinamibacterales bacterium]
MPLRTRLRSAARQAPTGWREIPVDRGDVGVRLDIVLLRHLAHEPAVSRARIQKWIAQGRVQVNGQPAPRVAWRVAAGDLVRMQTRELRGRSRPQPEARDLDVLYEDAHLLALHKPAGLVVHPSYKHQAGTLFNGLLWRAAAWPSGDAPALLTRLDKMTSGVLLVAKRREVVVALQREMKAQRIEKDYLAVVRGVPAPASGTIDLALDRDPWDRRKVTVTDRGGQRAVTRYARLAVSSDDDPHPVCSLVRCRLVTGRMHQIRVHLAHKGWPLVGDPTYGPPDAAPPFSRQALHAWRVSLIHPVTGEPLEVVAPVPDDLVHLLATLGLPIPDGGD